MRSTRESLNWADLFYLDSQSPSGLRWAIDIYGGRGYKVLNIKKGQQAGGLNNLGYWVVEYKSKSYKVHRILWEMHHGEKLLKDESVDHIDGNPSNNELTNLRKTSHQFNHQNKKKQSNNKTGVTGVYYSEKGNTKRYVAIWTENFKQRSKSFNLRKYDDAFNEAVNYRKKMIEELNAKGGNYTSRHGK